MSLHVATHYFGPARWGAYVAGSALIALLISIEDLGIQTFVSREMATNRHEAETIYRHALSVRLVLAAMAGVLAICTAFGIYSGRTLAISIVIASSPTLIADAILSSSSSAFQAQSRLIPIGLVEFIIAFLGFAATYASRYAHLPLITYALLVTMASLCGALISMIFVHWKLSLRHSLTFAHWRSLLASSLPFAIIALIGNTYAQLDTILLALFRPASQIAWYGLATMGMLLISSGPSFLMSGLLPQFATATPNERTHLFQHSADIILSYSVFLFVASLTLSPVVISAIAGNQFNGAVLPLAILSAGTASTMQNSVYANGLIATGYERSLISIGLTVLAVNVATNLAFIPPFGATGAAISFVISEIASVVLTGRKFAKLLGPIPRLRHVAWHGIAAALMVLIWVLFRTILPTNMGPVLKLLVEGGSMLLAYVVVVGRFVPIFKINKI